MASSGDKLTPLQRDLLTAFFTHEQRFFLTGGAALAGFYLHHRPTLDLDLFTLDPEAFATGHASWRRRRTNLAPSWPSASTRRDSNGSW